MTFEENKSLGNYIFPTEFLKHMHDYWGEKIKTCSIEFSTCKDIHL
jgi:hypothetical protein